MANTPKDNNNYIALEIISNKKNHFTLNICNNSDSCLEIEVKSSDNIYNLTYSGKFTLTSLKKLCKYFMMCESIEEVICSMKPLIGKSNLIEKNNEIDLLIPINHPLCKEALLTIPQKAKEVSESINELYKLIVNLKNIINSQQESINKQQEEIKELKKRIEILELQNGKYIEKNIEEDNGLNDSLILLDNKKSKESIKNWINRDKNLYFKLIFRKSRDGINCSDFHKHCDAQGPTVCLIRTTKNYKFGAYSSIFWQSSYKLSNENEGIVFLLSIDLNQKFEKIKKGAIQFSDYNYGPCFGDGGGCLYLKSDLNYGFIQNSNFLTNCELTHGEEKDFQVDEFEVFKVEFM